MNGKLVISLDYELHWGIFDVKEVSEYRENLENTNDAIYRILNLSNEHNIKLTFATVGFLFCKTKDELKQYIPDIKPSYINKKFNPYLLVESIGENEDEDPFHYAQSVLKKISMYKSHEIGTHTFCHYYCLEEGQNDVEFNSDIETAIKVAKKLNIQIKSIVFPRNQVKSNYLKVCLKNGITSYRGNEKTWIFKPKKMGALAKALRLFDSYINLYGYHTYSISDLSNTLNSCLNIPSSRFLRPYNKKLWLLEPLKLRRIKKAMTHAAKNKELYHLWWHPHNFGSNLDQNINTLNSIYKHFQKLQKEYNFESETMSSLTSKISN